MTIHFGAEAGAPFVALIDGGRVIHLEKGGPGADALGLLDSALKKSGRKMDGATGVSVDRGPGGFSAVRRRLAAALSVAAALDLPVAVCSACPVERALELKARDFVRGRAVEPLYDGEPNITVGRRAALGTKRKI